jgi:hypothetical protein
MRSPVVAVVAVAIVVLGCGTSTASRPTPALSPASSAATAVSRCPAIDFSSELASRSLTGVAASSGGPAGSVVFTFGPPDPAWPAGPPTVSIAVAEPPFTQDPSGLPLDVPGDARVRVRFANMKLVDDAGVPMYGGPASFAPGGGPIRTVAEEGAFEGIINWLIGYDGDGCVSVDVTPDRLTVAIGALPVAQ